MPSKKTQKKPPASPVLWISSAIVIAGLLLWPFWTPPIRKINHPSPSAPSFDLYLSPGIQRSVSESEQPDIERVIRKQKRNALYPNRSLLSSLEIVRERQSAFQNAAQKAGLDERLFEGLIVLECGGTDAAIDYMFRQGRGKRAHVGLGQIGWIEGRSAGLKVTPEYESRLKGEIRRSLGLVRANFGGQGTVKHSGNWRLAFLNSLNRQVALMENWRRKDERFNPDKNLIAAAKLLKDRVRTYKGDVTLAVASYHAGGGNIGKALRLAKQGKPHSASFSYWDLYEDQKGPVYQLMSGWSDDSRNYLLKVLAAGDIVEKYLKAPDQFSAEYLAWGPENAKSQLAALPYDAVKAGSVSPEG